MAIALIIPHPPDKRLFEYSLSNISLSPLSYKLLYIVKIPIWSQPMTMESLEEVVDTHQVTLYFLYLSVCGNKI